MKAFLWIVSMLCLLAWSAGAWLAYAIIDVSGDWASGNADAVTTHPETVEWLSWLARFLSGFGEVAVAVIWAAGALVLVFVPWALGKLLDRNRRPSPPLAP
jgi:hypothetical protein